MEHRKASVKKKLVVFMSIGFFVSVFYMMIIIGQVVGGGSWVMDGDRVYVDNTDVFIQVRPHTITSSSPVYFDFTPKGYTGDVDVMWGFDTDAVKPTSAWLYSPHEVYTTHSYTCNADYFNYTTGPNHFWCWNLAQDNSTLEWYYELEAERDFEWGDIPSRTAYWSTSRTEDYVEISGAFESVSYEYGGMDKWWYKRYVPVVAGNDYQVKIDMNIPFNIQSSGKYWFAIKPSSETIQQAIASGHLYYLDPGGDTAT